jgi:hypothetical protein
MRGLSLFVERNMLDEVNFQRMVKRKNGCGIKAIRFRVAVSRSHPLEAFAIGSKPMAGIIETRYVGF